MVFALTTGFLERMTFSKRSSSLGINAPRMNDSSAANRMTSSADCAITISTRYPPGTSGRQRNVSPPSSNVGPTLPFAGVDSNTLSGLTLVPGFFFGGMGLLSLSGGQRIYQIRIRLGAGVVHLLGEDVDA